MARGRVSCCEHLSCSDAGMDLRRGRLVSRHHLVLSVDVRTVESTES